MTTANIASAQVSIGTVAETLVISARIGRKVLKLFFTEPVYIGPAEVTASTGFLIPSSPSGQLSITLDTEAEIHAIATSTPAIAYVFEQF